VRALIKQFVDAEDARSRYRTPSWPTCSRSRASSARAAPSPNTASSSRYRRPRCARRCWFQQSR
jgi:hypothetical protein